MKIRFLLIFVFLFSMSACDKKLATQEQFDRFESYREVFRVHKELTSVIGTQSDSAAVLIEDISKHDLHELIDKYHLGKEDIEPFLHELSVSVEIIKAHDQLNAAGNHENEIEEALKKASATLNTHGTHNTIPTANMDTTEQNVKVTVSSYDSTENK